MLLAEPEAQGEVAVPVPVPPGIKPCTWWVKTPNLGGEQHYLPQGGVWLSLGFFFFSWVFKVFHHLPGNSWVSAVWMSDSWIPVNDL